MLPINPPSDRLGRENAILSGSGTRYHVPDFEGPLSVKSVINGTAIWESERRRYSLPESHWLVLNDRQRYTITIDSIKPVKTFCLFFERGFVEDIHRVHGTPCRALLDTPQPTQPRSLEFFPRIEPPSSALSKLLTSFYQELALGPTNKTDWDLNFLRAGELLVSTQPDMLKALARLPAIRKSTRIELYQRLLRGRDFLLSSLSEPIQLKDMACAACLSPFHFHRSFTRAFGETPHRYLTRYRLERAARLLRQTDLTVTEVCLANGFDSVSSFSTLFRRQYGMAPSKFSKIQ